MAFRSPVINITVNRIFSFVPDGTCSSLAREPSDKSLGYCRSPCGLWRLVLFDVPTGQNARREPLRRYLRDKGFGYLQNSVWITPDPLAEEPQILGGGKINVESLILLEARPCASSLAHRMGEGGRQAG